MLAMFIVGSVLGGSVGFLIGGLLIMNSSYVRDLEADRRKARGDEK